MPRHIRLTGVSLLLLGIPTLAASSGNVWAAAPTAAAGERDKINHVIVIYQENWSFDSLYGMFPGANGIANAGDTVKQVDKDNQPLTSLPQPLDNSKRPPVPDARFPANMPVQPFDF